MKKHNMSSLDKLCIKPKTHSERTEFAKNNSPKIVQGIKMIAKFFEDIKNK